MASSENEGLRLLNLRPSGMFSNVNEVVEQLRLAERDGYRFYIDWSRSCYRDPEREGDPWGYYFEPCFHDLPDQPADLPVLTGGEPIACSRANVITPRIEDGNCEPLLLPRNRHDANAIIERYIKLKSEIEEAIESFKIKNFRDQMIGLHIRGAGRTDGGVPELRSRFGQGESVPLAPFFNQVDKVLELLPNAGILACSDSSLVMADIKARYPDRVCSWPAVRSAFGEMHRANPVKENQGLTFDTWQLGVDVVSEAWLLSQTDVFVHGNSNVANFVISKSPYLVHAYVPA